MRNKDNKNNRLISFSRSASAIAFLVACLVLVGWLFDMPVFKSVLPGMVTMKANTALCFMLLGISLWLLIPEQSSQRDRFIAKVFASVVATIGTLTLSEYIFGWDPGIDQLLFREPPDAVGTSHPGRMAPSTALNFTMLGIALFLVDTKKKHIPDITQVFAFVIILIGFMNLTGYIYGVRVLYGIGYYTQMALHTAVIFILLGLGVLLVRPYQGLMAAVTSEHTGSFMFRRILPAAIVIPLAVGWLELIGERVGLYSTEFGVSLFGIIQVVILSIVIWTHAIVLNRIDIERKKAERELIKYHGHLEELVENRTAELKKVNRALKTLSECNQILVRAKEESTLLNDICRVITDVGGYRLAWVGYAEQDEKKTVHTVSHAGYEEGYLDTLNITWDGSERGRGPAGTAIRTGKESIFRNVVTDIDFSPWREDAIKRGYASVIGLPLKTSSHIFGVLTIYSSEPDAFDTEEVKLLTELANDLAYGISTLRTRAERNRAEEALHKSKALLNATGQMAKVGGWEFDPLTLKGTWTDEVARIHEVDPEMETNAELGLSFYQGESRAKIEAAVKEAIELEKPYDLELEMVTAKGNHKWVRTIGHPIIENGKVVKVRGSFQDITEIKGAEEEIRKLNTELEQRVIERTAQLESANKELEMRKQEAEAAKLQAIAASRAKSDFLANMSHELRTPLNSVIGFSEILQDELYGKLNKQQKDYVNDILSSGRHLLNLINDILDLSKIESGKMRLELSSFPLSNVLNISVTIFKEKTMKHNIELSLEIDPDAEIEIEADERKLKQVMFNLLSNAVKFTPDGGSVSVQAQYPTRDFVAISVEDTGMGIKSEDMDKLFKEFSQLETPYEKKYEGTGLGLSLTKKLVELHGGRIWVESEYGKGSKFSLVIPVRQGS